MTGTDPERSARRLRWAAEQLGLSAEASPEEVRAAWLRRLPDEDFVPAPSERWALAALLRRPAEAGWEARADEAATVAAEEELRGEVEDFAAEFWELPPAPRRQRWQELTARSTFAPAVWARLRLLERGLDLDTHLPGVEGGAAEVAAHLRELFVLRPDDRARARQMLLERMKGESEAWRVKAVWLRRVAPALATLGADLLDQMIVAPRKPARPPKRVPQWVQVPSTENVYRKPKREQTAGSGRAPLWLLWVAVCVVMGIIRGATKTDDRPPVTFPSFPAIPTFPKTPIQPWKPPVPLAERKDGEVDPDKIKDERLRMDVKRILEQLDENRKKQGPGDEQRKPDREAP